MWRIASPVPDRESPDVEGWIRLRVEFGDAEEARFVVLGLGSGVDVIEPVSLRDHVAEDVAALIARAGMSDPVS